ncbi:hypothetical protein AVEN_176146-1 [Araneus ventricosus]|uniref:Uncharacterized protein n=1 Tax=Araneus ventricosus TaxID=182803 RepID=A0A4Y2QEP6_ARAVE|nr:hypothetical protein AVEN_176146-1 [Araneus ventricosus]
MMGSLEFFFYRKWRCFSAVDRSQPILPARSSYLKVKEKTGLLKNSIIVVEGKEEEQPMENAGAVKWRLHFLVFSCPQEDTQKAFLSEIRAFQLAPLVKVTESDIP